MATGIPKPKTNGANHQARESKSRIKIQYDGKRSIAEIIASCPKAELSVLQIPSGKDCWNNRLYLGENLGVLGALLDDPTVRGKVSLVYIDPPYATNSVFESREQKLAYEDLLSGPHFIEFLRERLIILRELLSPRGSIYLHLDDNMAFPMKIIMDEVFGSENFRNFITRKKCNTKNYTRRNFGNVSDFILFYSKTENFEWNRPVVEWTEETAKKEYTYIEPETGRRFKKVPVHAPGVRNGETGKAWRGMFPPPGKHWQFSPSTLDEMDRRGEIFWSANGNPRRKIYLENSEGIPVQDIWLEFKDAHNQNIEITGYPTEKNFDMLQLIVSASSQVGGLVLDCFAGSGTTLAAASVLGRRWIGIDNSEEAINTIVKRLRHGTKPMGDFVTRKANIAKTDHLELFSLDTVMIENPPLSRSIEDFILYEANANCNRKSEVHLSETRQSAKGKKELGTPIIYPGSSRKGPKPKRKLAKHAQL